MPSNVQAVDFGIEPGFPYAPDDWSMDVAYATVLSEGLTPNDELWEVVSALQEYFARHADIPGLRTRELSDALDERFHAKGGMKHLYILFPGGPVTQGCRIAGIEPPAGSQDAGFGSVQ